MEERTSKVEADVGNLSEQLDNLMQENAEITRAAKAMIEELSSTLKGSKPHPKSVRLVAGFCVTRAAWSYHRDWKRGVSRSRSDFKGKSLSCRFPFSRASSSSG